MKNLIKHILLIVMIVTVVACNDDDNNNEQARVSFTLVDAPGDYDEVLIDVQGITIKYSDDEENEDDVSEINLDVQNTGVVDLLELTGGENLVLVDDDEIAAGRISQVRLILGDNNSVVVDGENIPLSTPSAQQSGLKLNVNQEVTGGIIYDFILDFDADKSIVQQGNGGYSLKPVIRTELRAASGAITGSVNPAEIQTSVTASNDDNEITTFTDVDGNYQLSGVPAGIYTLTLQRTVLDTNDDEELQTETVENVSVSNGSVTSVQVVDFD